MARNPDEEEQKRIIKQAIKEWLNEQMAAFGWKSFWFLLSVALAGLVPFMLWVNGATIKLPTN